MGIEFTNRQRREQYRTKGRPVLALEFDAFPDGDVSMWAHTRHEIPFAEMHAAFEAIQQHLARFIADAGMCPFNPAFLALAQGVPPQPLVRDLDPDVRREETTP